MYNCQGLRSKLQEVRQLIGQAKPHFVLLTETWLNADIYDGELVVDNYSLYRSDRLDGEHGLAAI
jgi:hypothetical protein